MTYDDLIKHIARSSGIDNTTIRAVLDALPIALMLDEVDGKTITPLGTFTLKEKKSRPHKMPDGTPVQIKGKIFSKLKPGKRLQVLDDDPRWSFYHKD